MNGSYIIIYHHISLQTATCALAGSLVVGASIPCFQGIRSQRLTGTSGHLVNTMGPGARSLGAWRLDDDIPQSAMANSVAGWWFQPTPLKNDGVKVSWDDDIPNVMEKYKPCSKPPTR